jgi:hypothetical protein
LERLHLVVQTVSDSEKSLGPAREEEDLLSSTSQTEEEASEEDEETREEDEEELISSVREEEKMFSATVHERHVDPSTLAHNKQHSIIIVLLTFSWYPPLHLL